VASWAGEIPGRPSRGYQAAKSSSSYRPSSRSRTHVAVVPAGLLARAICAVSSGTSTPGGDGSTSRAPHVSRRTHCPRKTGPPPQQRQPNAQIPDRVKLRELRRRFCDQGWRFASNGAVFIGASSVAVKRYRYRGSTIPTPWTPDPAAAQDG
jgi:hypothetical protein